MNIENILNRFTWYNSSLWQAADEKIKNLQSASYSIFKFIKDLEKEPKISGDVVGELLTESQTALYAFWNKPGFQTFIDLAGTVSYAKHTFKDATSAFGGYFS